MTKVDQASINKVLLKNGFTRQQKKSDLFLIGEPRPVTPAYYCRIVRKQGKVRLGGAIGLFFSEFEVIWNLSLSNKERRIDLTLPIIMLIDNYRELIESDVFRYSGLVGIYNSVGRIYNLTSQLPNSMEELDEVLIEGSLIGKPVHDYLHIFDYYDDDNLYFRKSSSFVYWFIESFPQFAEHLRQCLTSCQRQRLRL